MTGDAPPEPAIRVRGIEKSFKDVRVLRGVDFEVAKGSIFALLGSNGAGKTTLVRILSTLLRPDAGTAMVNGFDVTTEPGSVRESISLTGQFAAVDEILSGRENLVLIARLRHLSNPHELADDLLTRFSLTEAAGRRVATYSGGMRRRLDIAMSLLGISSAAPVMSAVRRPRGGKHLDHSPAHLLAVHQFGDRRVSAQARLKGVLTAVSHPAVWPRRYHGRNERISRENSRERPSCRCVRQSSRADRVRERTLR